MKTLTALVTDLVSRRVLKSERAISAMTEIDRGHFVGDPDNKQIPFDAYQDSPLPIGYDVTISAPHMHAWALEQLEPFLQPGSQALDIGSGSGYLTACLATMVNPGGTVLGIDNRRELVERSIRAIRKFYPTLKGIEIVTGSGWNDEQFVGRKFDAIHVGAAAPEVPAVLLNALKAPGRLVIPVGPEFGLQFMTIITKDKDGNISTEKEIPVRYVPLEQ